MKTTTDNHIDKLLHEAMKQRAAKVPPLADDFAEKVLGSLTPRPLQKKRELKFWPLVVAACMVGFVVIFLAPPKSTEEQLPLALEEPVVNSQESRVESQEPRASSRLSTQPSPKGATGVFRVATECGYGPTKGSESPFATEGKDGGGLSTACCCKA